MIDKYYYADVHKYYKYINNKYFSYQICVGYSNVTRLKYLN